MDPISIAMGLAQFAPAIVRWVSGSDKAGEVAEKVVDVAKIVTGTATGEDALAAIQADPSLVLQFRQRIIDVEADLDKAYLADRQNARNRDVALAQAGHRNVRADIMVAVAFFSVICIALVLAYFTDLKGEVIGFLTAVGGMFARNIGTAFDFEFGSSRSSQNKDAVIGKVLGR